jgi:hypothetical protein
MQDDYYCSHLLARGRLSQTCPSTAPAPQRVKSSLHNLCMICLADTTMEGQQPGILELGDEAEAYAYALLGGGLPDCLPCEARTA